MMVKKISPSKIPGSQLTRGNSRIPILTYGSVSNGKCTNPDVYTENESTSDSTLDSSICSENGHTRCQNSAISSSNENSGEQESQDELKNCAPANDKCSAYSISSDSVVSVTAEYMNYAGNHDNNVMANDDCTEFSEGAETDITGDENVDASTERFGVETIGLMDEACFKNSIDGGTNLLGDGTYPDDENLANAVSNDEHYIGEIDAQMGSYVPDDFELDDLCNGEFIDDDFADCVDLVCD